MLILGKITSILRSKNRYFIPKFIEQQQKMTAKLHSLQKNYCLCSNILFTRKVKVYSCKWNVGSFKR